VDNRFETVLTRKITRTPDCFSYRFERPGGLDYLAGQFFFITLHGAADLRKPFSFSSSPTEDFVELTTRPSASDFKKALDALPIGGVVTVEGPFGQFTLREDSRKVAFLSGGIGVTPIRSIVKYVTDEGLDVDIVLLYSNRTATSIPFRDELDAMAKSSQLRVIHCLGEPPEDWQGYRGRITRSVIEAEIPDHAERLFYLCGPPGMVDAMRTILAEIGIGRERIVVERFAGYA